MGRLIDADKLKQHYSWWGGLIGDDYVSELVEQKKVFDTIVDVQPTVDAVPIENYRSMEQTVFKLNKVIADAEPVRHGHWISHDYDFAPAESTQECSVCHKEQPIYMVDNNYCPFCGAKMDEVKEDG